MPRLLPRSWPSPKPPPDAVYVELVDMLFRNNIGAVILTGTAIVCAGGLIAAAKRDAVVSALTLGCLLVSAIRVWSFLAYRRRALSPLTPDEARSWERRYSMGLLALATLFGALSARAVQMDDPLFGMLIMGTIFPYNSGIMARMSVRPSICMAGLVLATTPAMIAFGLHFAGVGVFSRLAVWWLTAFIVVAYGAATWGAVNHIYEMTLQQLIAKRQLALLAAQDPLTGLPNRSLLRTRFDEALAAAGRAGGILAIHCLDLDRFKAVNDTFGHPTGDALLRAVAQRLERARGPGDTVARLGGDEFVVIQVGLAHPDEALRLARQIREALDETYRIDGHELEIGVSIGIALAPRDGRELELLSARGDAALYQAKREGRGVVFWGEGSTASPSGPGERKVRPAPSLAASG